MLLLNFIINLSALVLKDIILLSEFYLFDYIAYIIYKTP